MARVAFDDVWIWNCFTRQLYAPLRARQRTADLGFWAAVEHVDEQGFLRSRIRPVVNADPHIPIRAVSEGDEARSISISIDA